VGEERRDVSVRAEAEQDEVERADAAELARVLLDALHPVYGARRDREPVEERLLRHAEVRALVLGRDAALVSPPDVDAAPVGLELRRDLVRVLRRRASGEDD